MWLAMQPGRATERAGLAQTSTCLGGQDGAAPPGEEVCWDLHASGERVGVPASGHGDGQESSPHGVMSPVNFHLWPSHSSHGHPGEPRRSFP